ncbi:MAG: hypothetical protein JWO83_1335 [Caulobacteraceae bacterium]|nr:hypothetical protein [Caulobacteraceae bacterium]
MLSYRLYFQGNDGLVVRAEGFFCPDDSDAIEIAKEMADGRPMELWQQARKVMSFPAELQTLRG